MSVVAIIPVYNRKDIVFSAIDSVVNQTQSPDHLVVVDDGSTDGLPQEFADWEDKRSDSLAHTRKLTKKAQSLAQLHATAHALGLHQPRLRDEAPTW